MSKVSASGWCRLCSNVRVNSVVGQRSGSAWLNNHDLRIKSWCCSKFFWLHSIFNSGLWVWHPLHDEVILPDYFYTKRSAPGLVTVMVMQTFWPLTSVSVYLQLRHLLPNDWCGSSMLGSWNAATRSRPLSWLICYFFDHLLPLIDGCCLLFQLYYQSPRTSPFDVCQCQFFCTLLHHRTEKIWVVVLSKLALHCQVHPAEWSSSQQWCHYSLFIPKCSHSFCSLKETLTVRSVPAVARDGRQT